MCALLVEIIVVHMLSLKYFPFAKKFADLTSQQELFTTPEGYEIQAVVHIADDGFTPTLFLGETDESVFIHVNNEAELLTL